MQKNKVSKSCLKPTLSESRENFRCGCGSLMARTLKEGIELKCRRCKGITLIPLSGIADGVQNIWAEAFRVR